MYLSALVYLLHGDFRELLIFGKGGGVRGGINNILDGRLSHSVSVNFFILFLYLTMIYTPKIAP